MTAVPPARQRVTPVQSRNDIRVCGMVRAASRATVRGRAPIEAGWSTITRTVPNFAASLSKTFLPAGVSPCPWWALLPTPRPRKTPTSSMSSNASSRTGCGAGQGVGVVCAPQVIDSTGGGTSHAGPAASSPLAGPRRTSRGRRPPRCPCSTSSCSALGVVSANLCRRNRCVRNCVSVRGDRATGVSSLLLQVPEGFRRMRSPSWTVSYLHIGSAQLPSAKLHLAEGGEAVQEPTQE